MRTLIFVAVIALHLSACARPVSNGLSETVNSAPPGAAIVAGNMPPPAEGPDDDRPDDTDSSQPPQGPAADEVILSNSNDPVVRHCEEDARMEMAYEHRQIERTLVTRSPRWGIIWRADMRRPDGVTGRSTCTAQTASYRQVDFGPRGIPPLPGS